MPLKPITLLVFLYLSADGLAQSTKISPINVFAAGGYNLNPYSTNSAGYYVKAGVEYTLIKNLSANIYYWHTHSGYMPGNIAKMPSFFYQEAEFMKRFIGMSRADFYSGKCRYRIINGEIINVGMAYKIHFKKGARFSIAPKIGYNYCSNLFVNFGLFGASFINDKLVSGTAEIDLRKTNVWGINAGCTFNYKIKDRFEVLIDVDKFTSSGTSSGWNFFEAANLGAGVRYFFKK